MHDDVGQAGTVLRPDLADALRPVIFDNNLNPGGAADTDSTAKNQYFYATKYTDSEAYSFLRTRFSHVEYMHTSERCGLATEGPSPHMTVKNQWQRGAERLSCLSGLAFHFLVFTGVKHHFVRMTGRHPRVPFRPIIRDSVGKDRPSAVKARRSNRPRSRIKG